MDGASFRALEIIIKKRRGQQLAEDDIRFIIDGAVSGSVPDYQLAALLMAVCWQGMSIEETMAMTLAMAQSGATLDLGGISPAAVDKHSTGGVGDKTTLVVGPMVAACGVPVAKMSGHALGFSGGTLDKLSVIPGLRTCISEAEFLDVLQRVGFVVTGQSKDFNPADGRLYAIRDVTATVDSVPLIASSVLSKKLAGGAKVIVIDVKVGSGAFMKDLDQATELARTLVSVGRLVGLRVTAVVSSMQQPLGWAIGNALELREAVLALRGKCPSDLLELSVALGVQLLMGSGVVDTEAEANRRLNNALRSGTALAKLEEFVAAVGGDLSVLRNPDLLVRAPIERPLKSPVSGYLSAVDTERLGWVALKLQQGDGSADSAKRGATGLVMHAKIGDFVSDETPLLTIHANCEDDFLSAAESLREAFVFSGSAVEKPVLIKRIFTVADAELLIGSPG